LPDPQSTSVPPAPPPAVRSPTQFTSNRRWGIAVGAGIALAGHVPASGVWLYTLYTATFDGPPDTVFLAVCLLVVLQLMLFPCVPAGLSLYRSQHRDVGLGLLAGWGAGIVALVTGTGLLFLVASVL
jgi:hypothetical protein